MKKPPLLRFLMLTMLAALLLVLLVLALIAFSVDVQVGIPRFWTGVGVTLFTLASWFLYPTLPGNDLRLGVLDKDGNGEVVGGIVVMRHQAGHPVEIPGGIGIDQGADDGFRTGTVV